MTKFYVTYGWGYEQRNCYSVIEADDMLEAQEKLHVIGSDYAFLYTEADKKMAIDRFSLEEIPLQRQSKPVDEYSGKCGEK